MFTKVLRKSLTILAVYIIVIIGIFIIQFKNDSIISEKIGSLHITLVESTQDDNTINFRNKFSAVFNGISFSVSDENPVKIIRGKNELPVSLLSWKKESPLSCIFQFTEGVSLKFSLSDDSQNALMNMEAILPSNIQSVSIPYSLSGGATLTDHSDTKLQINSKKSTWELTAADIIDNKVFMTKKSPVISYAYYDKTKQFSFAMTTSLEGATERKYSSTIENLKNELISTFEAIPVDSSISEQEAVSYVAVMASQGKYPEAIENVPQSFKKSTNRTYISAPYFDNLAMMNESLIRQQKTFSDMISLAAENGSLEVFTVKNLSDYMCMHPGSEAINKLLSNTASRDLSEISIQQAAGILSVYVELTSKANTLAKILEPATNACISKIESSCNLDNEKLTIVEKGTFLSVINAAQVGDAVLRYGRIVENQDYVAGGRLIINSYLKDCSSFDLRSLSELYPIVVHNNKYYPHYSLMGFDKKGAVWAWTCAENITYENDNAGQITLTVKFPLSYTHYLIVNGIDTFKSIYIYDMAFRTDPRFETYNSSGYVYQKDNYSLLLKSRHRSENEVIRLVYSDAEEEKLNDFEEVNISSGEKPETPASEE